MSTSRTSLRDWAIGLLAIAMVACLTTCMLVVVALLVGGVYSAIAAGFVLAAKFAMWFWALL